MWDPEFSEGNQLGDWVKGRLDKMLWERMYTTDKINKEKVMFSEDCTNDDVD